MNIIDFLAMIIAALLGIIALVILWFDLHIRRKGEAEDRVFQREKFNKEEEQRDAWKRWLEQERAELVKMGDSLSRIIASELSKNNRWASDALERAKLGPYIETIFGDRKSHFRLEKELIADQFTRLLLRRCKHLIEHENKHVYLLVDSGTTLYPFFKILGEETARAHQFNENWITGNQPQQPARNRSKLTIVTNNLPGVEALMESGRPNPNNRYSDLAVDCRLLPGAPLPIYSAVTGRETEKAIQDLRAQMDETGNAVFIGLVTGNWVRIRRHKTRCPLPLARGEGHLEFKQELINACISDEIYVVSPLGKIFANVDREDVNTMLEFKEKSKNPDQERYMEVDVYHHTDHVKLVSTFRRDGRLLHNLSSYLRGQLNISESIDEVEFVSAKVGKTRHILYLFDDLPNDRRLEMEVEFPHGHTRTDEFMKQFTNP